jgi:hypothetical protein
VSRRVWGGAFLLLRPSACGAEYERLSFPAVVARGVVYVRRSL